MPVNHPTFVKECSVGVLGGSFDPVHRAHIELACFVQQHLHLDEFRLIPCYVQPHKSQLHASANHRLAMLQLAVAGTDLQVDTREIMRGGPSYSADTVRQLREEFGKAASINFVMGQDAWQNFCHWHRWEDILTYVNVIILHRPGVVDTAQDPRLAELLREHEWQSDEKGDAGITQYPCGKILRLAAREYAIASTDVRQRVQRGQANHGQLDPKVEQYIVEHALYTTSNKLNQSS